MSERAAHAREVGTAQPIAKNFIRLALFVAVAFWATWVGLILFRTLHLPPSFGNEAEQMYEAARIDRHLPLYTDPLAGAMDGGALPVRRYVLYGPIAPWLLSLFNAGARLYVARGVSVAAWFIGFPALAWLAPKPRRAALLVAALALCTLFLLAREVIFFTLTPLPALLGALALAQLARAQRASPLVWASLVFGILLKPVAPGIAIGIGLAHLIYRPAGWVRTLAVGAALAILSLFAMALFTSGAWMVHLSAATANGFEPMRWVYLIWERAPLLVVPHAAALFVLHRERSSSDSLAAQCARCALLVSLLWAVFEMGKRGANPGYFIEPTAALVIALATSAAPGSSLGRYKQRLLQGLVVLPLISIAASIHFVLQLAARDPQVEWAALEQMQHACKLTPARNGVWASVPELELPVDGRVTLAVWQHGILVRRGLFPLDLLLQDLKSPGFACILATDDLQAPPDAAPATLHDGSILRYELRSAILANFEETATIRGVHVFTPRQHATP